MTMLETETAAGIQRHPRERDNVRTLFVGKHRRPVLQIQRDAEYPEMWRVRLPDVTLTDMTNISRAKEAAVDIAIGIEARKTPHKSPLTSLANFSWARPPVAPLQESYLEPIKPAEIAPAAKSATHKAAEDPPLPTVPDAPPIAPRASTAAPKPPKLPKPARVAAADARARDSWVAPAEDGIPAGKITGGTGADMPDIPEFLRRA